MPHTTAEHLLATQDKLDHDSREWLKKLAKLKKKLKECK